MSPCCVPRPLGHSCSTFLVPVIPFSAVDLSHHPPLSHPPTCPASEGSRAVITLYGLGSLTQP